jgi:hypothetical protein
MTARSFQFPIPRVYPPGYARARPLFALSAAGGRRREVPRVTNVHDPRRSFSASFPTAFALPLSGQQSGCPLLDGRSSGRIPSAFRATS